MSDMTMHDGARRDDGAGAGGAKAMAIFLWVVVALGLAYGLFHTLKTAADLFAG
jgi:hypothetical protein